MASSMNIVRTPTSDLNFISSAVRMKSKSNSSKSGKSNTIGVIFVLSSVMYCRYFHVQSILELIRNQAQVVL